MEARPSNAEDRDRPVVQEVGGVRSSILQEVDGGGSIEVVSSGWIDWRFGESWLRMMKRMRWFRYDCDSSWLSQICEHTGRFQPAPREGEVCVLASQHHARWCGGLSISSCSCGNSRRPNTYYKVNLKIWTPFPARSIPFGDEACWEKFRVFLSPLFFPGVSTYSCGKGC